MHNLTLGIYYKYTSKKQTDMTTIKVTVNGQDMGTFKVSSYEYARQQWTAMYGDSVELTVCD